MKQYAFLCVFVALFVGGAAIGCSAAHDAAHGGQNVDGVPPTAPGVPTPQGLPDPTTPDRPVDPDVGIPLAPPDPSIPIDTRAVAQPDAPPPPISGGTLLIAADGFTAVVADSDRDRVVFVDLRSSEILGEVALDTGAEPGRLVQDAAGRVHVALRGAGKLASFDLPTRSLLGTHEVCASPRGVAYDARTDQLHVACLDGDLVSLAAATGELQRRANLGTDLRDVTVTAKGLRVTRFRAAEVLELDQDASPLAERALRTVREATFDPFSGQMKLRSFEPALARRAVALADDTTLVLHQRALVDAIELEDPHAKDMGAEGGAGSGAVPLREGDFMGGGGGSAYGGGGGCSAIVQTAVSLVDGEGGVTHSFSLSGVTLPVDMAISADRRMVAVADAGRRDPEAPLRGFEGGSFGLSVFSLTDGGSMTSSEELGENCTFGEVEVAGQPVAVAFTPDGAVVVQSREPAQLQVLGGPSNRVIPLGGESRADTGHDIFHRDAGAGIACASCHGEGGDDGHVWNFSTFGPRRTQSVNVGLEGTAPFHWSGDMANLSTLVGEVFVQRMGGVNQSFGRIDALADWMFAQRAPASPRDAHDEAALRGKQLFESEGVACASCHNGSKLTNNKTVNVGTGEPLQVPTLLGIAYRAPYLHDGCAPTLRDRFDPSCGGGDQHGRTSQLNETELDDLVAYLETL